MQHIKTCLSRPQGQYWAGRTFPPNNPPPNMAAANFVRITNVSLLTHVCRIELIAIFRKNRRHQSVFVTSEYTSSTTTTTTTTAASTHLLQTHRCMKDRGEFTLLGSHWLWRLSPQWERGARLMEQPLPHCWSTNSVPRAFFPRVATGCRVSLKIDRNLSLLQ